MDYEYQKIYKKEYIKKNTKRKRQVTIFFPHWLWTFPRLFSFIRLCLLRFEQILSMSIPKSNSKIVMLSFSCL